MQWHEERRMRKNVRLNELTYRQYLALAYIVSKWNIERKHATASELKRIIGFSTDRMLKITLEALERKGFIRFHGLNHNPIAEITDNTARIMPFLTDKLLLVEEYLPYKEIKERIALREKGKRDYLSVKPQVPFVDSLAFLNNKRRIVHRWSDFLEDFPPSLVWSVFERFLKCATAARAAVVLDPFCGSGTTLVTAKLLGHEGIGLDANPVAAFISEVKTSWDIPPKDFRAEANAILNALSSASELLDAVRVSTEAFSLMDKMELNQWLKPSVQNEVAFVSEAVKEEVEDERIRRLLLLALVESARAASNVSFCPGTSFYPFRKRPSFAEAFKRKCSQIYEDLLILSRLNGFGNTKIFTGDARKLTEYIEEEVDFILTSPPYPNDLEYTRQTRLDLYLLGFVKSMKDVAAIKKRMVCGSTKLIYKDARGNAKFVEKYESVQHIFERLKEAFSGKNWGWDYPRMVKEYFGDIFVVLRETKKVLKEHGIAVFVVGDQTYKQILIPVGAIMSEIAEDLGYETKRETFRVRRSTLHNIPLKEEIVILKIAR